LLRIKSDRHFWLEAWTFCSLRSLCPSQWYVRTRIARGKSNASISGRGLVVLGSTHDRSELGVERGGEESAFCRLVQPRLGKRRAVIVVLFLTQMFSAHVAWSVDGAGHVHHEASATEPLRRLDHHRRVLDLLSWNVSLASFVRNDLIALFQRALHPPHHGLLGVSDSGREPRDRTRRFHRRLCCVYLRSVSVRRLVQ
jgi:hypothetical protein